MKIVQVFLMINGGSLLYGAGYNPQQYYLKQVIDRYQQQADMFSKMAADSGALLDAIVLVDKEKPLGKLINHNSNEKGLVYYQNFMHLNKELKRALEADIFGDAKTKKLNLLGIKLQKSATRTYLSIHRYLKNMLEQNGKKFKLNKSVRELILDDTAQAYEDISQGFCADFIVLNDYQLHTKYFKTLDAAIQDTEKCANLLREKCNKYQQSQILSKKVVKRQIDLFFVQGWMDTYGIMQKYILAINPEEPLKKYESSEKESCTVS